MEAIKLHLTDQDHLSLVDEYTALDTNEDRLTFVMERPPLHEPVPAAFVTEERKVPGCLSGLWLHATRIEESYYFSAKSDSAVVQGIASLLCDLYSGRRAEDILSIGDTFGTVLGLERLLSLTRRRAVLSTISFILNSARRGASE